jgi:hypothetical protein|eukprot:COSAG06_NODE_21501_length_755_cov_0.548780_2_plen_41_part_00
MVLLRQLLSEALLLAASNTTIDSGLSQQRRALQAGQKCDQ